MKNSTLLLALVALFVSPAACNSDSSDSGAGGAAGSAGGPGGTAGTAGSGGAAGNGNTLASTRSCGDGAPCQPGATCGLELIESGIRCTCDPSNHFLCDSWAAAGAPPVEPCNEQFSCDPGEFGEVIDGCEWSNGYCTRSCNCDGECSVTCDGDGPAEPRLTGCDADYCDTNDVAWACKVNDGDSCNYEVRCQYDADPVITGSCEPL